MTRLILLLTAETAAVGLTHRLSAVHRASFGLDWAQQASLEQLLVGLGHLAAWVAAWWLLLGTLHDLVLTAVGEVRRVRANGLRANGTSGSCCRLAPAWVQRAVNQAVGTLLMIGVIAGPAAASIGAGDTPPLVQVLVTPPVPAIGDPVPTDSGTGPADVAGEGPMEGDVDDGALPEPAPEAATPGTADQMDDDLRDDDLRGDDLRDDDLGEDLPGARDAADHVVAAGENLWVIARAELLEVTGRPPTDREVHAYWVALIAANEVRSGDPDRIFPGEVLRLPARIIETTP